LEIKGDVSERKRKNLMALRQKVFDALKDGGEVQKDILACLKLASEDA